MTMAEYLEKYRQKKKDMAAIDAAMTDLRTQIDGLKNQLCEVSNEIWQMRKVISTAIDENIDPAEVILRYDEQERIENLWTDELVDISPSLDSSMIKYPKTPTRITKSIIV